MEIIEITLLPWGEPTFHTAEEAIAYAKTHNDLLQTDDLFECAEHEIVSVRWNDCGVEIFLDNSKIIQFRCEGSALRFGVSDVPLSSVNEENTLGDVALLRIGSRNVTWNRANMLNGFIGKIFRKVHLSKSHALIYVRGMPLIAFSVFVMQKNGNPFLYWGESD